MMGAGEFAPTVLDALSSHLAVLDSSQRVVAVNAAWRRFAAMERAPAATPIGQDYLAACRMLRWEGSDCPPLAAPLRAVVRGERPLAEFEERLLDKESGEPRWFRVRIARLAGEGGHTLVAHDEVTALRTLADELGRLSGRLLVAQDEERRRIARDLHDSTAQNLLAATLSIRGAQRLSPRLGRQAAAMLSESESLIQRSQQEIRALASLLHPPMLEEIGLDASLDWLADRFAGLTGLSIAVEAVRVPPELPDDHAVALFRFAQEALANVHRHAEASAVTIRLALVGRGKARQIRLSVADNGRGPPATTAESTPVRPGVGLLGLRERLRNLGGQIAIGPAPAGGTLVAATLPLGR